MASRENGGSVWMGGLWMVVISVLLCWLPGVGGFLGGLVGGKVAGGVWPALLAWLASSLIVGIAFATLGTLLSGMIVIGVLAGMGGVFIAMIDSGARLVGAIIGGLIA